MANSCCHRVKARVQLEIDSHLQSHSYLNHLAAYVHIYGFHLMTAEIGCTCVCAQVCVIRPLHNGTPTLCKTLQQFYLR